MCDILVTLEPVERCLCFPSCVYDPLNPPGSREISSEDSLCVSLVPDIQENYYDKKQKRDLSGAYQYSLVAYSSFLSGRVPLAVVIVAAVRSLSSVRCRAGA